MAGNAGKTAPPQTQHVEPSREFTYPGFASAVSSECRINGMDMPCGLQERLISAEVLSSSSSRRDANGHWVFTEDPIRNQGGIFTTYTYYTNGFNEPAARFAFVEPTKSDCQKTVDDLVNRQRYRQLSAQATAVTIGRYMAWAAVNGRFRKGHDDASLGTSGFQAGLVANGQGADVYKHIYGVAGGTLIGDRTAGVIPGLPGRAGMTGNENVTAQINDDQAAASNGRLESYAELADDYAGMQVGSYMLDRIAGKIDNLQLSDALFHILCSY